jgi:hypothetical protein
MKSAASLAIAMIALSACSDDAPSNANPPKLWLALDGSETRVRLADFEPEPF